MRISVGRLPSWAALRKNRWMAKHSLAVEEELRSAYEGVLKQGESVPPHKYSAVEQQARYFLNQVYSARSARIGNHLDIGSGAMGLAVASRSAGFSPFAVDADFSFPEYRTIADRLQIPHLLFNVPKSGEFLTPKQLRDADFPDKFSLITVLSTELDRHGDHIWGPGTWAIFLGFVEDLLTDDGLLLLKVNRHSNFASPHRSPDHYDTRVWRILQSGQQGNFRHRTVGLKRKSFARVIADLEALGAS